MNHIEEEVSVIELVEENVTRGLGGEGNLPRRGILRFSLKVMAEWKSEVRFWVPAK